MKTILRFHVTLVKMAKSKKTMDNKHICMYMVVCVCKKHSMDSVGCIYIFIHMYILQIM